MVDKSPDDNSRQTNSEVILARLDEKLSGVIRDIQELKTTVVSKAEFKPVQMIAFGIVAIVCVAVLGVLLANAGIGK